MECKTCNWYLCEHCHPQEKEPRSWLWSSVSFLAEKASQELQDLQEVAENAETMGPLAACAAPPVLRGEDAEIQIGEEVAHSDAPTDATRTPAGAVKTSNAEASDIAAH